MLEYQQNQTGTFSSAWLLEAFEKIYIVPDSFRQKHFNFVLPPNFELRELQFSDIPFLS